MKLALTLLLLSLLPQLALAASDFLAIDPALKRAAEEKWNRTSYSETNISSIKPSTSYATKIPLQLIVLKGSSWTHQTLFEELRNVERIYSQCEVSFAPITLIEARAPMKLDDLNTEYNFDADLQLFPAEVVVHKPALVFQERGTAYSWPRYLMEARQVLGQPTSSQLENTGVISHFSYAFNKSTPDVDPTFSVTAHELAHILLNRDHNLTKGDLLCGLRNCKGSQLSPKACEILKENLASFSFN